MKVILDGKEVKCHSFCDLKPGDVFTYCGNCCNQSVYIKTNQNSCFNVCTGAIEGYTNAPIVPYLDAVLFLDCHKHHHHCKKDDCKKDDCKKEDCKRECKD